MSEARWQRVKALFEAAVDTPPPERAAFLAAATDGDEALRREVEALLDSDSSGIGFTDQLPVPDMSLLRDLAEGSPSSDATRTAPGLAGTQVGPYRVVALLGAGGMGEVFRARDSKLHRDVALKLLPAAFELDPDRLARFKREARVLAALNHPNIAAIYGLEESNGRQALVLELVEGVTLSQRIAGRPLALADALTIARQIASALEAAHEKGIVHRDLKPANVKVTPTGVVKVLDFGLAKTAAGDLEVTGELPSAPAPGHTQVGAVLGTAAYMSPEQARGQEVDARTDVWAFGCVLFEMLAGRRVFAAEQTSNFVAGILEGEPDWGSLPKSTPAPIARLLRQCLQKDRRHRLQTVAEARLAIDKVLAPRAVPRWAWIAAVAAAALAVGVYVWSLSDRPPPASRSDWVQLTSLDSVTQPALSPDGRLLAFVRGPSTFLAPGQVYIKQLPDGEPVALTSDTLPKMSPVFSPDGSRIAYTVTDGGQWDTWEVPTLRGAPRRWLRNASGLTWLGNDDLLFSEIKSGQHMGIVRSGEGRTDARDLYLPRHTNGMAHRSYASPDRSHVLVVEMDERSLWVPCRLLTIAGAASRAVGPAKARCTNAAWSPDGRWMYFSAHAGDGYHLWRQRFPDGTPEQLTSGPTEEEGIALAADGKSLVTSVGLTQRSVWFHDASGERQVSLEGHAYYPLLSADGRRLCFRVTPGLASGQTPSELWMVELESGQKHRLFPGLLVTGYDISRDDRVVAAIAEPLGRTSLWLAWLDGREAPRRIPSADGDNPRFGPDGRILFRVTEKDSSALYRMQADGQHRERVAPATGTVFGTISPDGEWLSSVGPRTREYILLSTIGRPSRPLAMQTFRLRWSLDGRRAYLSVQDGGASAFAIGRTYVVPLAQGTVLPPIPPGGFQSEADIAATPGVQTLPYGDVAPGPSSSIYAFSRVTTTRNLYRIPLE